jgi:menaquinone-9 beta-reductase
LGGSPEKIEGPRWVAVGDAAGGVDPLVGDGVGLALRGGLLAARAIDQMLEGWTVPGNYTRARARLVRKKRLMAAAVLALSRRPRLAEAAVALLSRRPGLFSRLLSS